MKINVAYLILSIQLIVVFLSEFISRYLSVFSKITQIGFSVLFIALLLYFYKNKNHPNMVGFVLLSITILVVGLFRNQFFINLFQLILVCSNFVFVFYANKINPLIAKRLINVIILFCIAQLFFDVIFPKDAIDLNDQYSGTFIMANNKSRFLFFILLFLVFLKKNWFVYKSIGKIFTILVILYSAYLGQSNLGLALIFLSLILAYFFKSLYGITLFLVLSIFVISIVAQKSYIERKRGEDYSALNMNYERYFDSETGVAAVYKYGYEKLSESYFIGVGYGNFSSRSGQLFDSEITKNIPKQMIKKWYPLFENKSPYGLSSLFVLVVELGVFALFPIIILFRWLNSIMKTSKFYLKAMVIFVFVIINYNPTFFEFNESILYILTLILVGKLPDLNE